MTEASESISISQSDSIGRAAWMEQVTDNRGFGPVDVIAGLRPEIGAVSSMGGFDEMDVGIGKDFCAGLGGQSDERVIDREQDQRWHGDAIDHSRGGGSVVVIVGIAETAIAGDNLVVEFPKRADGANALHFVDVREERGLAAIARHQAAQEVPFVEPVGGFVESVRAGREVDGRANRSDGAKRSAGFPLSGKLQNQVAAHRIADKSYALQAKALRIVVDNGA